MNAYSPMILDNKANTRIDTSRTMAKVGFHDTSTVNTAIGAVPPGPTQHDKIKAQAQKWVAATFFGSMLKQMRESPFKTDLSSGGRGGEAFGTMLDQHLAEKMARVAGSKLVNTIVRKIEAKQAYEKQSKAKMQSEMEEKDAQKHEMPKPKGVSYVPAGH